jgi:hypothetical protein
MMDVDAEINACLDIIAEFSTQRNEQTICKGLSGINLDLHCLQDLGFIF